MSTSPMAVPTVNALHTFCLVSVGFQSAWDGKRPATSQNSLEAGKPSLAPTFMEAGESQVLCQGYRPTGVRGRGWSGWRGGTLNCTHLGVI